MSGKLFKFSKSKFEYTKSDLFSLINFSSKYDFENECESDLPISPKFIRSYKSLSSVIWSALNGFKSKTKAAEEFKKKYQGKSASEIEEFAKANKDKSPEEVASPFTLEAAAGVFGEGDNRTPLTFGYPDMCKFELILYRDDPEARQRDAEGDIVPITVLFKSDFCMIGNITIDYGASNKMVFLAPPTPTGGGKADYFPSEVNMTIALIESVLVTAEYASGQSASLAGRQGKITIF